MAISNKDRISRALDLLREGLTPFVERELKARLGARGEVARDLAYRLYGICDRKKWAEEGIAYNGLVVAWPEISKLAAQAGPAGPAEPELAL